MSAQAAAIASAFEPAAKRQRTDEPLNGQERLHSHADRSPALRQQLPASQSQAIASQPAVRNPGSTGGWHQVASSQSPPTASQPSARNPGSTGERQRVASLQSQATASQPAVRHPRSVGAWQQVARHQKRQTAIQQANQQPGPVTVWDNAFQHEEQREQQKTLRAALEGPGSLGAWRQGVTQHQQHPQRYATLQLSAQQPGPINAGSQQQKRSSSQHTVQQPVAVLAVSDSAEQPHEQRDTSHPAIQHSGTVESWHHGIGQHEPQASRDRQPQQPVIFETRLDRAAQQQPQAPLQQVVQHPRIGQATRENAQQLLGTLHQTTLQATGKQREADAALHQVGDQLQRRATLQSVYQMGAAEAWPYQGSQQQYQASTQRAAQQLVIVDASNEEVTRQQPHAPAHRDMKQLESGEANRQGTVQQQEKLHERTLKAVEGQLEFTGIRVQAGEQRRQRTTSQPAVQQLGTVETWRPKVKQTAQELSSQQPVGPAGIDSQQLRGMPQHGQVVESKPDLQQPRDAFHKSQSNTREPDAQVAGDMETFHLSPSARNTHAEGVEETKKEDAPHSPTDRGVLGEEAVVRLLEEHRDVLEWFGKTCVKTVIPKLSGWAAGDGGSDTDARLRARAADAASKMKMHVNFAQRILRMLASKGSDVDKVPKWCAQLRQRREMIEQFISNAERRRPESGLADLKLDLASFLSSREASTGAMLEALPCLARFEQLCIKDRERTFIAVSPLDSMKARISLLFGDDRSLLNLSVVLVSIEEDIDGNEMPESAFALWRLASARASQAAASFVAAAVSAPNEPASAPFALMAATLIESAKIVSQCARSAARNVAEQHEKEQDGLSSQLSKHDHERASYGVKAADLYVPPRSSFRFAALDDVGQPIADLGGGWGQ